MSLYDHRYPTSSPDVNKTRRYFWIVIVIFALFLVVRIALFKTSASDEIHFSSSSKDNHFHRSGAGFRSGGIPHLRPGQHPQDAQLSPQIKSEIIHDQLVPHAPDTVEKHPAEDTGEDDDKNNNKNHLSSSSVSSGDHVLGMKGERLTKETLFKVKQKNHRKPFHTPEPISERKRLFDDIDIPEERNEKRRLKIKEEMKWAWKSYKSVAWGYDELHSVTRKPRSWIDGTHGFAMTIFDSLDTLYLMNLTKEFHDGVDYLYSKFDLYINAGCSTFEATIRLLGGTLSSYELSGDPRLLRIAEKVGWILIAGLETNNGMLHDHVNFKTRAGTSMGWLNGNNLVSELGSLQLEFRTLSYHIKDPIFDMRVTHLMSILKSGCEKHGYACPTMFNSGSGRPASHGFTLGGMADSYFEYVVKQYVLTGGVETELEHMSKVMLKTIEEYMIVEKRIKQRNNKDRRSPEQIEEDEDDNKKQHDEDQEKDEHKQRELLKNLEEEKALWSVVYPGTWDGRIEDHEHDDKDPLNQMILKNLQEEENKRRRGRNSGNSRNSKHNHNSNNNNNNDHHAHGGRHSRKNPHQPGTLTLEHLTCFAGGMFALAALNMKSLHQDTRQRYAQIGHDMTETCANMYFSQNSGLAPEEVSLEGGSGFNVNRNEYRLRPETVESIFYMWRITGDEMYREWAWTIFDSMIRFCRMPWGGFSGILDVTKVEEPDPEQAIKGHTDTAFWDDLQQSYFMAETMKYLYLTFADTNLVNLEEWVFNTESHPMKIRQRDPREVWYDWRKKHNGQSRWVAPHINDIKPFYPELSGDYKDE